MAGHRTTMADIEAARKDAAEDFSRLQRQLQEAQEERAKLEEWLENQSQSIVTLHQIAKDKIERAEAAKRDAAEQRALAKRRGEAIRCHLATPPMVGGKGTCFKYHCGCHMEVTIPAEAHPQSGQEEGDGD